ncbi:MAG: glycosyltransferase family 4 protein [Phormidesmis sp.]
MLDLVRHENMNVLFVNVSDLKGGAALGSYRLHEELLVRGFKSYMLVGESTSRSKLVNQLSVRFIDKLLKPLLKFAGLNYINSVSSFESVTSHPFYKQADILNFHCLHGGFFNYLALPKITKDKPAIYKLSDMWSFTGHCSYSFDCQKWVTGCGQCPYLEIHPSVKRDLTHLEWRLKSWAYENSNMTIVVPSRWLKETAQRSILRKYNIVLIPNGINTSVYAPIDRSIARQAIGIPSGKKVILFAAQNLQDRRKGGDLLVSALKRLPTDVTDHLILVCLGHGGSYIKESVDLPLIELGYASGDRLKVLAYSSADIFVCPTRADTFGLVLLESIACGTPVVSFDTTAVPELVRPGITGLLAKAESSSDLADKIIELLENDLMRQSMAKSCRQIAVDEYSIELQTERYISLYRQTIQNFRENLR